MSRIDIFRESKRRRRRTQFEFNAASSAFCHSTRLLTQFLLDYIIVKYIHLPQGAKSCTLIKAASSAAAAATTFSKKRLRFEMIRDKKKQPLLVKQTITSGSYYSRNVYLNNRRLHRHQRLINRNMLISSTLQIYSGAFAINFKCI